MESVNTGITRRIDKLGRIVIPKELRETFRIKVGTPMQIIADGEKIVLCKFSSISIFEEDAAAAAKSLAEMSGQTVALCGADAVLAAYGKEKALFKGKDLTEAYARAAENRKTFVSQNAGDFEKYFGAGKDLFFAVRPLSQHGDILGSLVMAGQEAKNLDLKLLELTGAIIEKQFS